MLLGQFLTALSLLRAGVRMPVPMLAQVLSPPLLPAVVPVPLRVWDAALMRVQAAPS